MTRPEAGTLAYPGNVEHIVGEVKGSALTGHNLVAVVAKYDGRRRKTRVTFGYLMAGEDETVTRDEFGIVRLPSVTA